MIKIIAVGKIKEDYLKAAVAEYQKRLSKFCKLAIVETREIPRQNSSDNTIDEGRLILKHIKPDDFTVLLDRSGKEFPSEKLAETIRLREMRGDITFIIGGAFGVSEEVQNRADLRLSFSLLTFPHQLMRVILLEQLYRAYTIINNINYHH